MWDKLKSLKIAIILVLSITLFVAVITNFNPLDHIRYSKRYKLGDHACDALIAQCGYCGGERKNDYCYVKRGQWVPPGTETENL